MKEQFNALFTFILEPELDGKLLRDTVDWQTKKAMKIAQSYADSEVEKLADLANELVLEAELLGKDLQEIENNERTQPSALLDNGLIKRAKAALSDRTKPF